MHFEHPRFSAQNVFNNDESPAGSPTKWIDILEGCDDATLPHSNETLIAEFARVVEEERGRVLQNGLSGDGKTVRQFRHRTQLCLSASKYRDGGTMAYYKNHRSPWFEKMLEERQWLEEQEEIRHEGET